MTFKYLSIIKNIIFWVDTKKEGSNQYDVIFARPFNDKDAVPQQLTGLEFCIKSNFHGYGGKSYKCLEVNQKFYLIWIDQISKAVWLQIFEKLEIIDSSSKKYLIPVEEPRKLSKSIDGNFDSSFVITKKNLLYGICEIGNSDYLVSLNLEKTNQEINKIINFDNFAGYLSSNKSNNLLSWIEWDTPYMPWEKNDLFFAEIDNNGDLKNKNKFPNKLIDTNKKISFFQPHWISDDVLVCSEDSSGWWNLIFIDVGQINKIFIKKRINRELFEYGSPQWISGLTFFSGSIKNLFCLAKKGNIWILERYQDLKLSDQFKLPYSSIIDFSSFDKKLALSGNGYNFLGHFIEIDFEKNVSSYFFKNNSIDYIKEYAEPEAFWFQGFDNQPTHSFLYKPLINRFRKPPLLLRAHSGPTAYFDGSYNSEVQYWTSKGFFVAEVNYGGSSGFGRKYRERLNCKWGIIDSYDCKALVMKLINYKLVDEDKIVIFGNSAGGLTALNSLCQEEIFKAAICKYPVIDLKDMHQNTHRFEKDYLTSLVGKFEENTIEYSRRSPIYKILKTTKPILIFHGIKDTVISYKQSLKIKEKLIQNNKYSEVIFFSDEGHGFKNVDNRKKFIQKTEDFLNKVFNI